MTKIDPDKLATLKLVTSGDALAVAKTLDSLEELAATTPKALVGFVSGLASEYAAYAMIEYAKAVTTAAGVLPSRYMVCDREALGQEIEKRVARALYYQQGGS